MKILDSFLATPPKDKRTNGVIISWWETRRVLYNFIVFIAGTLSLFLISLFINVPEGEDLFEPIAAFLFLVLCNIGYTFGWIIELFLKNDPDTNLAPKLFKAGLFFTLFWVMLPSIIHFIYWINRGFKVVVM